MAAKFNYRQIEGVDGNARVSDEFIKAVEKMAANLQTKPEYLLAAMSFETGGTFDPAIQNGIGATGLIQFLIPTAKNLGTTTDDLKKMTPVAQLAFVEKYFVPFKGRLATLEAVYTAILSGAPKKPDDVLFTAGTPAYKLNPLDWNADGQITAAEATTIVGARLFGGVRRVQQKLIDLNFVAAEIKANFADGQWGKNTGVALAKFQKSKKLPETGLMDEKTGQELFAAASGNTQPTQPLVLEKGTSGDAVKKLQNDLKNFGLLTAEQIETGYGNFGAQTDAAVKAFQKIVGFAENGKFGAGEQFAVETIVNGIGKASNAPAQIIKAVQNQLVKLGIMTQAQVDGGYGTFGNLTEAAVKKFQKDNLLQQSGVVETVTFAVLFGKAKDDSDAAKEDYEIARDGKDYTVLEGILMTKSLQKKLDKLAALYVAKAGSKLIVTSGFRPPERQAPAMYDKIIREGETAVRNLYRGTAAIDEILAAYRANKQTREKAIGAITATIEKQIKRGTMISSHLLSNALDVRMRTTNLQILKDCVIAVGGRVVVESDHYHLELY